MELTEYTVYMRSGEELKIGAKLCKEIRTGNHLNFFSPDATKDGEKYFYPIGQVEKIVKRDVAPRIEVSFIDDYKPVDGTEPVDPEKVALDADALKAQIYARRADKANKAPHIMGEVKRGPGRPPKVLAEIEEVEKSESSLDKAMEGRIL